jgi:hypothetical protein
MRFNPRKDTRPLRSLLMLGIICALGLAVDGQDRHDWQSLARLQAGDRIRLSLKTGRVEGAFQNWTLEQVTAGTVTAKREDVLKIERYRPGAWGRGDKAAVGGLIGLGGGFVFGASIPGGRFERGAFLVLPGALIGALIGALLPTHSKELIYSAK